MPMRVHIEATEDREGSGPMPDYTLSYAPTWALEDLRHLVDEELYARRRIVMLVREQQKKGE